LTLAVSQIMEIASLPFADLVLISSCSAMTIIFSAIVSIVFLGEKMTKFDITALLLISSGTIICVTKSNMT